MRALRNIPPVLGIVWESGPAVVMWGMALRVVTAVTPLGMLAVTRLIIDAVVAHVARHEPLVRHFWALVALEFGLAALAAILTRAIDYCDTLLADKFTLHISVRIMEHASSLDLASYEDPAFYDKLQRARVQATDRLGMIQSIGRVLQQVITTVTLAAGIFFYTPWLLIVLVLAVIPAFFGETHFAFLGYSLSSASSTTCVTSGRARKAPRS
jgi:ATP-binding cassette subfamily B protein